MLTYHYPQLTDTERRLLCLLEDIVDCRDAECRHEISVDIFALFKDATIHASPSRKRPVVLGRVRR